MLSSTIVQVFSLTSGILGEAVILVLIATFLFDKSLPQRSNPFFLNFLIATLLTQIPPCLLYFSGDLGGHPPHWLCSTQAILMDGVLPMCGVSWVVVIYHTWTDLKATVIGGAPLGRKSFLFRFLLLTSPYFAFLSWSIASFAAVMIMPATWRLDELVFCVNESVLGIRVRQALSICLFGIGLLQFFVEILIGRLIYRSRRTARVPRISFRFALRLFVFCVAQLVPMILPVVNSVLLPRYIPVKQATQMLISTNALATFVILSTQRHILHAWKFWGRNVQAEDVKTVTSPGVSNAGSQSVMDIAPCPCPCLSEIITDQCPLPAHLQT